MKRIIATTLSIFSLVFPPLAIAQPATNPATQVQPAQVDKRDLIVVSARAIEDGKYKLALSVANNVIELFPNYGNGYLFKAIALYKLGSHEAARVAFTKAKGLYERQLEAASITPQEKKEANLGLEAVELHLKLLMKRN